MDKMNAMRGGNPVEAEHQAESRQRISCRTTVLSGLEPWPSGDQVDGFIRADVVVSSSFCAAEEERERLRREKEREVERDFQATAPGVKSDKKLGIELQHQHASAHDVENHESDILKARRRCVAVAWSLVVCAESVEDGRRLDTPRHARMAPRGVYSRRPGGAPP